MQKRHRPRSTSSPFGVGLCASVGQAFSHALQPSAHRELSRTGRPRNRSGSSGARSGYAPVRWPWRRRVARIRSMDRTSLSQVKAAVRKIEALVAQWKIRDLLPAKGHRQSLPVVEGRVDDLVSRELARRVGKPDMANLPSPPLDERYANPMRRELFDGHLRRAGPKLLELLSNECRRALDFQPAYVRAREHVACLPDGDGNVR